jgi:hypothetical protein
MARVSTSIMPQGGMGVSKGTRRGQVESRFFAMDVARTQAGNWIVVELGDGQVSQLSEDGDIDAFFAAMGGSNR